MAVTTSTDNGATWNCSELTAGFGNTTVVLKDPDYANHIFAAGYYQTPQTWSHPALFKTENNGNSWSEINVDFEGPPTCLCFDPFNHQKMYLGTHGRFFTSNDRGQTWTTDNQYRSVRAIVPDPGQVNILYMATSYGVHLSRDGGITWEEINQGLTTTNVNCLDYNPVDKVLYAGTEGGGVYRLSKPTGIENADTADNRPDQPVLHQNIPNPFNMNTEIRFRIKERTPVRIEIFDLQGRLVRELWDRDCEPGLFKTAWNGKDQIGNDISSGIYIYRLHTNQGIQHKKMILQK